MNTWTKLLFGATALTSIAMAAPAMAANLDDTVNFQIAPGSLDEALIAYGKQADLQVISASTAVRGKHTDGLSAATTPREALAMLLKDSGLHFVATGDNTVTVTSDPQSGSAAGDGADQGTVAALIVTAQKKEENVQDVPIAISAFSQKDLEAQKIEGGFDLLKAIPNVTFSKNNFTSYNFSIRGVGTKAISATTDPGVAVAFNNTTLIQNRLFEQEYFDVERVEVLRGPQGTLYGRNATSGVINVITAKPKLGEFEASIKAEVGNYDTKRLVGMVNIPLIGDVLAIRLAGAATQRSGYDYNETTKNSVNGRDLWSGRLTIGFEPTPTLRANLLWEHFNEDDDRSRTGKQLCHHDAGPAMIGSTPTGAKPSTAANGSEAYWALVRPAMFGQGCKPGSLYDDAAFGTPNGASLPFVFAPLLLGSDCGRGCYATTNIGGDPFATDPDLRPKGPIKQIDPYGGMMQSRDLRTIASIRDPRYRAKADVLELSVDFDITDALTLSSQTAYNKDEVYSFQDYNRFNSIPIFTDTSNIISPFDSGLTPWKDLSPGGVFCDPQIGCSDKLAGFDISQAQGEQFSQELRLQSDFDGPVNFSLGANYTKFKTLIDYYVFYNLITMLALTPPFYRPENFEIDYTTCAFSGDYITPIFGLPGDGPVPAGSPTANCPYIDPNPIESVNGEGHNYFRSKNPYALKSKAAFGELYWNLNDSLKVTAGLRYTEDRKSFTPVPSQILLAAGFLGGGTVSKGYPEKPAINQKWGEWTGRLGVDWKPKLDFTDETMLYAFYSRGYKGGGANPPSPGFASYEETIAFFDSVQAEPFAYFFVTNPVLSLTAVDYSPTFEPEFVDAFEVGAKNTLLGGAMSFNATGFFYDYKDYQVSQIRDRTAVNENFDATIWGLEFETVFAPSRDFRIIANLGYLDTRIADGESSIDIMNRTQGDPNYTLVKPWIQLPSNCVVPTPLAEAFVQQQGGYWGLCGGFQGVFGPDTQYDPNPEFGGGTLPYDPANYPELNGGLGLRAQLGGNELPNAPHWTTNLGAQYGWDILDGSWRATLRGDAYWQSQSWARVYNAVNDKLHGWYNVNVSVKVENKDLGLEAELYVKNVLDKSPITDAFLNSDDSALTTNVFVLDPRLVGLSVKKSF